ncbi:MAG: DegT/DnrJ/EryC1/StrS family aminotransferase [Deltaproteobacteria bacterium]|nr:DegT/DnrJ/EryC1/StrS family aminotransferase [Deltaproteobacteria bacterium]
MAIHMSSPDIDESDIAAVVEVMKTGRLSMGPKTKLFEERMAEATDRTHGVAVSSGTAGLHCAVMAAGITSEHEVVTTPFSFIPTANCFVFEGATPKLVDIEDVSFGPQVDALADAIGDKTRGIVIADLFCQPPDFDPIRAVADRHAIPIIEDACESLGAEYKGRPVGSLGDIAVFGFYPNKQITTGEGGMIVTDREDWANLCRSFRNQGRDVFDTWLEHSRIGYNYRLTELQAALGVSQLARLDRLMAGRERAANAYTERLAEIDWVTAPRLAPTTTKASWFVYTTQLAEDIDRDAVRVELENRGIPTRVYFPCIHLQKPYRERYGYKEGQFPVAERFSRRALTLPLHPHLQDAEVDQVVAALREAVDAVRG